jgi:hypothetical protein
MLTPRFVAYTLLILAIARWLDLLAAAELADVELPAATED